MASTPARESGCTVSMEYTPPTPPLTPQKHKLLSSNNSLNVKQSLISVTRSQVKEYKMRRSKPTDKYSSSSSPPPSSTSSSSAPECSSRPRSVDSIIPKIYSAAPPITLVSPLHSMLSHDMFEEDEDEYDDEEEKETKTFKLQDPPKRKARVFSELHDTGDEFDSSLQKSSQEVTSGSPSRAKGQTSITQFMIPASPQYGTRLRSKSFTQSPLPHFPYTKLVQSPCTPSKCAKSNDGGNFFFSDLPAGESNTFVFPSVSYSKTPLTPSTPPYLSHYKSNRKRSVDMSSIKDKEILDDFTDLNMASPSPISVDNRSVRGRCRSTQDESDYYNMAANQSSAVTPPSPRLVKSLCERRKTPSEASVYKDCFMRTSCRCHEENTSAGYSNRSYCKQADILEEDSLLCSTDRNVVCHGHKNSQESCQQKIRLDQRSCSTKVFRNSLSGLVPIDYIHDPEHPLPDDFPYESTFVPSYDKKGIYRKDEIYDRIQTLKDDSEAGKVMCRRWSSKEATRGRSGDNIHWDSDLLPSSPSHNEAAAHPSAILLPPSSSPSSFNLHHTSPKPSHLTSRHAAAYSHPAISPISKMSPAHAQSYRSSTSSGERRLDRSSQTSEVLYEEASGSSSCQREYLSALQPDPSLESSSLLRRQQSQLIPSTQNPFVFPSTQQTHSTPIKSPALPSPAPSSHSPASFHQSPCHINCPRRNSSSSSPYGWPSSGEMPCHQSCVYDYTDRQRNEVAKRRLFCRQPEEAEHSSTDGEANICCHHFPGDHRLHYPESPSSSSSSGQHRRSHYDSGDSHYSFAGRSPSSQHQVPPPPPPPPLSSPCNCCTSRCSMSHSHNSRCCIQRYHTAPPAYSQDDDYNI